MIKTVPISKALLKYTIWILPFYLPLAVFLADKGASIYLLSAWKELILAVLLIILVKLLFGLLNCKDRLVRLLNITIALYVILAILYLFFAENLFEFTAGFLFSTRFLLFFMVAQVIAVALRKLPDAIMRIVIISGVILSAIAIIQALVLPPTFLENIGYEPLYSDIPGIPPAVTTLGEVDDFIRPQAALRGPNPLGAFLVLPLALLGLRLFKDKRRDWKTILATLTIAVALVFTFSRSAWIAALVALFGIGFSNYHGRLRNIRKRYLLLGAILLIITGVPALQNKTVRLIILRQDVVTSEQSSDYLRSSLARNALEDVAQNPLGRGPGNAGPVSVLDENDQGRIAENYYLQVAQETGWLGLVLFVAIQIVLGLKLWALRTDPYALVAFCTLIGLSIANLTLHTWSDETVSIMWWSFAGAIIGASMNKKRATNG